MESVWKGIYTDEDGVVTKAEFTVNGDALAKWFAGSRHSKAAFRDTKAGKTVTTLRLGGGIIIYLERKDP